MFFSFSFFKKNIDFKLKLCIQIQLNHFFCSLQFCIFPQPAFLLVESRGWNVRLFLYLLVSLGCSTSPKLDGIGPVDNIPSRNKLITLTKKNKIWHMTCETWHVTRVMWHVTCDTWHMICDKLWGLNILLKFQLPSFYGLWFRISWRLGWKGLRTDLIN